MTTYSQNEGTSFDDAILIDDVDTHMEGIRAEKLWIANRYGVQNVDWFQVQQQLRFKNGRPYDILTIEFPDGDREDIYFDITVFFAYLSEAVDELESEMDPE